MVSHDVRQRTSRRRFVRFWGTCVVLAAGLAAGCGGRAKHDVVPVSGRVTVAGKPLVDVTVAFQPLAPPDSKGEAGFGSYGVTNAEGRFELAAVDGRHGAVVGEHAIRLGVKDSRPMVGDEAIGPPPKSALPPRASDGSLTFVVPPDGTDEANFDFL
ncbi:MAG: hypothetical protein JW809_04830 [Pirellulales bacterium]|nr:hypothetical protein [Pirellulales bacterium]